MSTNTIENIRKAEKMFKEMCEELGITEEMINSPELDYLEDDDAEEPEGVIIMDDSLDIGAEPLPMDEKSQRIYDEAMEKIKNLE